MKKYICYLLFLLGASNFSFTQTYFNQLIDVDGVNDQFFNMLFLNDSTIQFNSTSLGYADGTQSLALSEISIDGYSTQSNLIDYGQVNLYQGGSFGSVLLGQTVYSCIGPWEFAGQLLDALLLKNKDLDTIQTYSYSSGPGYRNGTESIVVASDSSLVIAGTKSINGNRDFWVQEVDTSGNVLWTSSFGGNLDDLLLSVDKVNGGGYLISGYTTSPSLNVNGTSDILLVKINNLGNLVWQKVIGTAGGQTGFVKELSTGDIILFGTQVNPNNNQFSSLIVKLDANGNEIGYYPLPVNEYRGILNDAFEAADGMIFTGIIFDENELINGLILKTDFNGNIIWERKYSPRQNDNYLRSILPMADGGFIVGGFCFSDNSVPNQTSDIWMMRTNCLGFDGPPESSFSYANDANFEIQFTNESMRYGTCKYIYGDGAEEIFTEHDPFENSHVYNGAGIYEVKLITYGCNNESDTLIQIVSPTILGVEEESFSQNITLFPNPVLEFLTIESDHNFQTVNVKDIHGKLIKSHDKLNTNEKTMNLKTFQNGLYFLEIISNGKSSSLKFVKE